MCTLAWGSTGEGQWVCFNRDESRTRSRALPPSIHRSGCRELLYPLDPDGGGTWFAADSNGTVVALLNRYPQGSAPPPSARRSRGKLVLELASMGPHVELSGMLPETDLSPYPPFHLFLMQADRVTGYTWDGGTLAPADFRPGFFTTSSREPDTVAAWRSAFWKKARQETSARGALGAARILRHTEPADPALGPTMDREDARTVSQLLLTTDRNGLAVRYREREPAGDGYRAPHCFVMKK